MVCQSCADIWPSGIQEQDSEGRPPSPSYGDGKLVSFEEALAIMAVQEEAEAEAAADDPSSPTAMAAEIARLQALVGQQQAEITALRSAAQLQQPGGGR